MFGVEAEAASLRDRWFGHCRGAPEVAEKGTAGPGPSGRSIGVADGTRTHDNRNHNPGLYQLSYSHHSRKLACPTGIEPVTLSLEG